MKILSAFSFLVIGAWSISFNDVVFGALMAGVHAGLFLYLMFARPEMEKPNKIVCTHAAGSAGGWLVVISTVLILVYGIVLTALGIQI